MNFVNTSHNYKNILTFPIEMSISYDKYYNRRDESMRIATKIKLLTTKEDKESLLQTLFTVNKASTYVSFKAFENKTFNKFKIHHLCYKEIRERYNLSSQLAIRAIAKVATSYGDFKNRFSVHKFNKYSSIGYDNRILSFNKKGISILSVNGRLKIPFISHLDISKLKICCQSELCYDKPTKTFYLSLIHEVNIPIPDEVNNNFIGCDMGITNLLVDSTGEIYNNPILDNKRIKIEKLRGRLQDVKTKSAKRRLIRLSKKERRFKKDVNHCISKKVINKAKAQRKGVKIENLKGISKLMVEIDNKEHKSKFGKWSFYELAEFITYKGKLKGVPVLKINPEYTSQTCSKCNHCEKDNRLEQSKFKCVKCGFEENADFNASINISRASVNMPIVSDSNKNLEIQATNF